MNSMYYYVINTKTMRVEGVFDLFQLAKDYIAESESCGENLIITMLVVG